MLHMELDFMVLNKPAGLPSQGGEGIPVSLDSLLPRLRFDGPEEPRCSLAPPHQLKQP